MVRGALSVVLTPASPARALPVTKREPTTTKVIITPMPFNVNGRKLGDLLFEGSVQEQGVYI